MYLQDIVEVCVNRLYYRIVVSDWDLCRTGAGTRYDLRLKHEKKCIAMMNTKAMKLQLFLFTLYMLLE